MYGQNKEMGEKIQIQVGLTKQLTQHSLLFGSEKRHRYQEEQVLRVFFSKLLNSFKTLHRKIFKKMFLIEKI